MFLVFLFPLFWLPVLLLYKIISVNLFVTLDIAFIISCVVYAVFENGFYSGIALLFCIFMLQILRMIYNVVSKRNRFLNKSSTVLVLKLLDDGTALAFDGISMMSLKIDSEFRIKEGSVLPISINGF